MKHFLSKKQFITCIISAVLLGGLGGCDFFASPSELFNTPTPEATGVIAKPGLTIVPEQTPSTPQITSDITNGPSPTSAEEPVATSAPVATPTATPSPIPTVPPAPATLNTDYKSTYDFIVNRACMLPETYAPDDLVALSECALDYDSLTDDKHKLRRVAAEALTKMFKDASAEDLKLVAVSGYRSFERQYQIYGNYLLTYSLSHTNRYSAVPGSSEHQTGLAMDLSCATISNKLIEEFVNTPEGKWVYEHCWEYGFIIRYPKEKTEITGYAYEPWHVRYVGVPLAYYLTTTGLTLEEYYNVRDPYEEAYLNSHPLIDITTAKYHKLYASAKYGKLIKTADGDDWVNPSTQYPYLIPALRDAKKTLVKDKKKQLIYLEPLTNVFGEYYLDNKGNIITKPVFLDENNNPVLDADGKPFYLEPLVEGDGNFVRNTDGSIVYRPLLKDSLGNVWLDAKGRPYQLVPLRNYDTYLITDEYGDITYFTPFADADHFGEGGLNDYELDENGNLQFSFYYYDTGLAQENGIAITESGIYPSNNQ